MDPRAEEKRLAAEAAAGEIADGSTVGLGTGSTVAFFLAALARRRLNLRCVATSPATERRARELGLPVEPFAELDRLDVAVDGADQVAPDLWLVKGAGGAHTREKVVAAAAARFLVIVSSDKLVERLGPPVPLEVLTFGLPATLRLLSELGPVRPRDVAPTPDGNLVVDYTGEFDDPSALAEYLRDIPGVVGHGLFPDVMVSTVLAARGTRVERRGPRGLPGGPG
jgi:ribose 5-phosphate isomerase A